jgi:large subunit ribosomal protein L29
MGRKDDVAKLRDRGSEELVREASGLRNEIWKLKVQRTTGQVEDHQAVRRAKRSLARVLTVIRERELRGS